MTRYVIESFFFIQLSSYVHFPKFSTRYPVLQVSGPHQAYLIFTPHNCTTWREVFILPTIRAFTSSKTPTKWLTDKWDWLPPSPLVAHQPQWFIVGWAACVILHLMSTALWSILPVSAKDMSTCIFLYWQRIRKAALNVRHICLSIQIKIKYYISPMP